MWTTQQVKKDLSKEFDLNFNSAGFNQSNETTSLADSSKLKLAGTEQTKHVKQID